MVSQAPLPRISVLHTHPRTSMHRAHKLRRLTLEHLFCMMKAWTARSPCHRDSTCPAPSERSVDPALAGRGPQMPNNRDDMQAWLRLLTVATPPSLGAFGDREASGAFSERRATG